MNAKRTGKIYLNNSLGQGQFHNVYEEDGVTVYYLGDAARTKDGFVIAPAELRHRITWDEVPNPTVSLESA